MNVTNIIGMAFIWVKDRINDYNTFILEKDRFEVLSLILMLMSALVLLFFYLPK